MWNGWEGLSVLHHTLSGSASLQTTAQKESHCTDLADFHIIWLLWMRKEEEAAINMIRGSIGSSGSAQSWKSTIQTQLNCVLLYHYRLCGGAFKHTRSSSNPTWGWRRTSDGNMEVMIWPIYFQMLVCFTSPGSIFLKPEGSFHLTEDLFTLIQFLWIL